MWSNFSSLLTLDYQAYLTIDLMDSQHQDSHLLVLKPSFP
jgi:hypothetical protein